VTFFNIAQELIDAVCPLFFVLLIFNKNSGLIEKLSFRGIKKGTLSLISLKITSKRFPKPNQEQLVRKRMCLILSPQGDIRILPISLNFEYRNEF
jgi:hypothetical protein